MFCIVDRTAIALDILCAFVMLILFLSCYGERKDRESRVFSFLHTLGSLFVVLIASAVCEICHGRTELAVLSLIAHTVTAMAGYFMITFFVSFFKAHLFLRDRTVRIVKTLLDGLCLCSSIALLFNLYFGFAFSLESGVYHAGPYRILLQLYPTVAILTLAATILIKLRGYERFIFLVYLVFPAAGTVIDYIFEGRHMTGIGAFITMVIIYTNIYLQKRKTIVDQRTALMISQINPHFMYNTLTTIASLCEVDPKMAKSVTIDFSSYLRRNLNTLTDTQPIPFEEELRHVGCYLKIEKARFGERIKVVYDIAEKDFSLPALTVQPLVENAVRHGISKKAEGGTVKLSCSRTENNYVIEIKDDGVGFDPALPQKDGKAHVGIENVRNRLHDMCKGTLTLHSVVGVGTRAVVEIPYKKGRSK